MFIVKYNKRAVLHLNHRCDCGRYEGYRYDGVVCEKCGVSICNRIIYLDRINFENAIADAQIINYPKPKK